MFQVGISPEGVEGTSQRRAVISLSLRVDSDETVSLHMGQSMDNVSLNFPSLDEARRFVGDLEFIVSAESRRQREERYTPNILTEEQRSSEEPIDKLYYAAKVIQTNPEIAAWLKENDPNAWEQLNDALPD